MTISNVDFECRFRMSISSVDFFLQHSRPWKDQFKNDLKIKIVSSKMILVSLQNSRLWKDHFKNDSICSKCSNFDRNFKFDCNFAPFRMSILNADFECQFPLSILNVDLFLHKIPDRPWKDHFKNDLRSRNIRFSFYFSRLGSFF
jgi:hypothetical protein